MFRSVRFLSALALTLAPVLALSACNSWEKQTTPDRTANRSVSGEIYYPDWLTEKPEFYEYSAAATNHDPQNAHPQQWQGQDWEPAAWNSEKWTPEIALQKLFDNKTFWAQRDRGNALLRPSDRGDITILELGPTFYKLSDLDRRRSLKLYADYTGALQKYKVIQLQDWKTHENIGLYTARGMQLY